MGLSLGLLKQTGNHTFRLGRGYSGTWCWRIQSKRIRSHCTGHSIGVGLSANSGSSPGSSGGRLSFTSYTSSRLTDNIIKKTERYKSSRIYYQCQQTMGPVIMVIKHRNSHWFILRLGYKSYLVEAVQYLCLLRQTVKICRLIAGRAMERGGGLAHDTGVW